MKKDHMFARIRKAIARLPHDHKWVTHDENYAKRRCSRCLRVEYLFQRSYPMVDQPALTWKFMYYAEKDNV